MKREIATLWIEALRSGKYQQTRGCLRRTASDPAKPEGFCCLGVLTDLHPDREWEGYRSTPQLTAFGDNLRLSKPVMDWSGIKTPTVNVNASVTLSILNDYKHWNFEQIAQLIERDWEKL